VARRKTAQDREQQAHPIFAQKELPLEFARPHLVPIHPGQQPAETYLLRVGWELPAMGFELEQFEVTHDSLAWEEQKEAAAEKPIRNTFGHPETNQVGAAAALEELAD